ncbi:hypothetical protein [Limibacterium fermenti]|uniref:hypothetical protein n=1 Tax=Limibacterium fermenti TaxID=3229863 RepID=UPI003A700C52
MGNHRGGGGYLFTSMLYASRENIFRKVGVKNILESTEHPYDIGRMDSVEYYSCPFGWPGRTLAGAKYYIGGIK